jgi:pimeloyl-ACP methyl ester carboxylesterase
LKYREFPVFLPVGDYHLCAVVCAPIGEVGDLGVVLLSGGNITRTHRNGMWVRAARTLAERGYASIRFDYHGVGDSTGTTMFDLERPFLQDVQAVAGFLRRATGITRLALAATCFGARSALAAAARRDDVVLVTMFPTPLRRGTRRASRSRTRDRIRRTGFGWSLLRKPLVVRLRRRLAGGRRLPGGTVSPNVVQDLSTFLGKGQVRFIYGERASYLQELRECVALVERHISREERDRLRIDVIPGAELHRFASLQEQDIAISRAVDSVLEADGAVSIAERPGDLQDRVDAG